MDGHGLKPLPAQMDAYFHKNVLFDIRVIRCSALRSKVRARAWELLSAVIAVSDYGKVGL